jgi:hypothetical protein
MDSREILRPAACTGTRDLFDRRETARSNGPSLRPIGRMPVGGIEKTASGKLARSATRRRYFEEFDRGR